MEGPLRSLSVALALACAAAGCRPETAAKPAAGRGLRFAALQAVTKRATAPYVVDCGSSDRRACLGAVRACGARVVAAVPTNSLLVETGVFALAALYTNRTFAAVRELKPDEKIAEGFAGGRATVVALAAADRPSVAAFLRARGASPLDDPTCGRCEIRVELTRALADELARRGEVRRIAP